MSWRRRGSFSDRPEWSRSTEPLDAKLASFLTRIGTRPVDDLHLAVNPNALHTLYPLDDSVYAGSIASWVGDYSAPAKKITFVASAGELNAHTRVDLPAESLAHPQLPRLWAQARVNALLDQIARDGETAMRALMRTDEEGRFWFRSVLPTSYPIPDDGPVGAMMRATGRNSIRPAHVHIRVDAPGFQRLTTMLFVDGDAHIASDPVFGVKDGLIHQFELAPDGITPDGIASDVPYYSVDFDFRLAPLVKAT